MAPATNKRARQSPEPYSKNKNINNNNNNNNSNSNNNNNNSNNSNNNNNNNNNNHPGTHPTLYPAPSSTPSTNSAPYASKNSNSSSSSSFRNVSACNRCRLRKNRCDQNLPACTSCQKASAKCVGFDPITHREIPRTYVYFLESRVAYLEEELSRHNIPCIAPSADFDLGSKPIVDAPSSTGQPPSSDPGGHPGGSGHSATARRHARARSFNSTAGSESGTEWEQKEESDKLNKLVSNIGMVSVQGASDPRYLGSTSGISFARVVFAAVKSSLNDKNGRNSSVGSATAAAGGATGGPSMRDSFFGLQTKPHFKPAPFPDRELGAKLVELYFEHPNPQMPILHRGDFMEMFARAYATGRERQRSARELYMLNIVFAIGAGTILLDSKSEAAIKQEPPAGASPPSLKKPKLSGVQRQPEEYHSSAMMHLESFLGSIPTPTSPEKPEVFGGSLEQLQAVLLLAGFALMRPVAPGLWYIVGVAMRLALDLGLHYEDGAGGGDNSVSSAVEEMNAGARSFDSAEKGISTEERGRREWVRDLRRRLWWCVYSFDRLVSTCVGRPFGVTDQVITTEWPSILDDKDITPSGFRISPYNYHGPSYKRVSHHYLRLRLLQSEILQVLQYRQAQRVHDRDRAGANIYMHTTLSSSFLQPFRNSFSAWRADIDHRLWEWKESAPLQKDTSVGFNVKFLELNYWQAVIMLYRQSLSVPPSLACEKGPHNDVDSPMSAHTEDHEDEDEIFLKVAEAGQRVLRLYKELHHVGLVNYTYLATVHLFMAGIAFLYSIWHSPMVRARMTLEHVEYTVRAATSVLGDLVQTCPPAEACRDAFDRMAKATIKMCQNTTGFGSQVRFSSDPPSASPFIPQGFHQQQNEIPKSVFSAGSILATGGSRPPPQFDYNFKDLFPEANLNLNLGRRFAHNEDSANVGWVPQPTGQASPSQFQSQSQPQHYHYPSPAPTSTSLTSSSTSNPTTSNPSSMTSNPHPQHPTFRHPSYGPTTAQQQSQQQQHYDPHLLNPPATMPPYDPTTPFDLNTSDLDFLLHHPDDTTIPHTFYTNDVAATTGLHLGFDGRADWTGRGGDMPDLFGGFFFGGGGGAGGQEQGQGGIMDEGE